jgi:23S rRNA (cytosine1962-C5)-methyltransferase
LFDEQTTGYRWINGESDGWPGLVLDRYETTLVLKLYTAAWLPRLEEVVALINQSLRPARIVLRLSRNIQPTAESQFQRPDGEIVLGESLTGPVIFQESGLRFEADVLRGQKTGFFLDQRENRRMVETVCSPPFRVLPSTAHGKVWTTNGEHPKGWATNGREVLNVFSFTGGFSVYAARGGARSVTDLDISAHALAGAKRNHALNQSHPAIAACRHEVIKGDASEWLAQNPKRRFDLVILDPPSLARRETERAGAIRAYARLASLGIEHLSGNGVLVACSCSAHVSAQEFFGAVRKSVSGSGRKFVELGTTGHAPDHPAAFKEAEYLKAIYLVTSPVD